MCKRFVAIFVILIQLCISGYAQKDAVERSVEVGYRKTTMLVFPRSIETADYGSPDILIRSVKKGSSVLKVKAAKEGFTPTNLTVFTSDGRFYCINVSYTDSPGKLVYLYSDTDQVSANRYYPDSLSKYAIELKANLLGKLKHSAILSKEKKYGISFLLKGIYVCDGKLFFVFQLYNFTDIPFDIQFTRYFKADARRQKLTSQAEREIMPVAFSCPFGTTVVRSKPVTFVAAFDQFTIADYKRFIVHIAEKGGDRQLKLRVKGKQLFRVKKL